METAVLATGHVWGLPVLVYVVTLLGLILFIKNLKTRNTVGNLPPSPAWSFPFVGHLPYLRKGMREQMAAWTKKSGDMMTLDFASRRLVVLNTYETAHQAFVKNADTMSDRPSIFVDTLEKQWYDRSNGRALGHGILSSSGYVWKEQRTIALHILRKFGMGKNILADKVQEEVAAYIDELVKLSGEASEVRTLTNTAVSNVICSIIVGKRFEFDDEFFIKFLETFNETVRLSTPNSLFTAFKWLRHLPGDFFNAKKRMNNFWFIEKSFCHHYISKTEEEYDENHLHNFIASYLCEMKKMEAQGKDTTLTKNNLSRVLNNLFVAGSETTSTTILWFLLYMLHYPNVQKKVHDEISESIGTHRAPTMQDRTKLNYTNAAIMETQRLASILPVGLEHYVTADTKINGYTIPAGSSVVANYDAILSSPDIWDSPEEFRPERFLDADGGLKQIDEFMPFSLGRRLCLGESLAKMELLLFVSGIVQRFELIPETPDNPPPRKAVNGITSPPQPFNIRFIDRLASHN